MMESKNQILSYLKWRRNALGKKGHGIHSPFLFKLVTEVIHQPIEADWVNHIEKRRNQLINDKRVIEVIDFGTGKRGCKDTFRSISAIAKSSSTSPADGRLIYHLANHMQSKNILELGTSLGLGTSYLAHSATKPLVTSVEGCPFVSNVAKETFNLLNLNNINLITGEFSGVLPDVIKAMPSIDLVFFDGNHRYEPTLCYFNWCLEKTNNQSVFIFDDIHQSAEMEKAWSEIANHPKVTLSLDFYWLGVIFFRQELSKQHFNLRY